MTVPFFKRPRAESKIVLSVPGLFERTLEKNIIKDLEKGHLAQGSAYKATVSDLTDYEVKKLPLGDVFTQGRKDVAKGVLQVAKMRLRGVK